MFSKKKQKTKHDRNLIRFSRLRTGFLNMYEAITSPDSFNVNKQRFVPFSALCITQS